MASPPSACVQDRPRCQGRDGQYRLSHTGRAPQILGQSETCLHGSLQARTASGVVDHCRVHGAGGAECCQVFSGGHCIVEGQRNDAVDSHDVCEGSGVAGDRRSCREPVEREKDATGDHQGADRHEEDGSGELAIEGLSRAVLHIHYRSSRLIRAQRSAEEQVLVPAASVASWLSSVCASALGCFAWARAIGSRPFRRCCGGLHSQIQCSPHRIRRGGAR